MSPKDMKVIIAGGSVAGLSLALMLEKNGIDFLVLEAYHSIAPQVGASIGLLPNGLRILDQLDCYEEILEQSEYPVNKVYFRNPDGKPFWCFDDLYDTLTERHGYPVVFFERRMLIQILYDKIQQKDKILTSERVVSVKNHPTHVDVSTKTGKTFTGTFVVGGDGIHSTVRQQMWDISHEKDPAWIDPGEKDALPATYACIFGISEGGPSVEKGTLNSVFNEHFSYLIPSGPGNKTYWFLVTNMGKTLYGSDIPRFTKEDEEKLVKKHWNDQITPTVRFSDLYEHKISSVYTPLPEYVYKKWYFERMMTIGDAAHKFEPLTGQGGNNAIETAASLTNHLISALKKNTSGDLTTSEIMSIFDKTQKQREDRTWSLVKQAHSRQRLECRETPLLSFISKNVLPRFPKSMLTDRWADGYAAGVSLDMLPASQKNHVVPFYDELLRPPSVRGNFAYGAYIAFAALAVVGFQLLFAAAQANGTLSLVRKTIVSGSVPELNGGLSQSFTGVAAIDKILTILVTFFLPAITSSNQEQPLQLFYFLSSMLPLIAIFTVEGYRQRNKWSLVSSPSIWGILYQLRGVGFIAPLYFAASIFGSRKSASFILPGHNVPAAKFILPALILGFMVPTGLLFFPFKDLASRQAIIALWQPAPVLVSCLTYGFAKFADISKSLSGQSKAPSAGRELSSLRAIYRTTGAIAACVHLTVVIGCLLSSDISLVQLLIPKSSFGRVESLADGVFIFFQNDFLLVTMASFLWSLVNIADLYRSGLSQVSWKMGVAYLIAGFALIGPGATTAALWFWREGAISRRKVVE